MTTTIFLLACVCTVVLTTSRLPTATAAPSAYETAEISQADSLSLVTRYVGVGYNLLKGNPEGEFSRGAIDPGILITKHIFEFSYDDAKTVYYQGSAKNRPDQVEFHAFSGFSMSSTLTAYSGQHSYQSQLSLSVEAEASYAGYDFSLSAGMDSARAGTEQQERVNIDKQEIHAFGRVRYQVENNDDPAYKVSTSFYNTIKDLPTEWSETEYFNFINEWGTHLLVQVDVGTRTIDRSYMSYAETYQYLKEKNNVGISAGGSYGLYSASFSVDIATMNEQIDESSQMEERTTTFSMGTEEEPLPVHMVLKPLTDALSSEYWNDLPNGDTYESLRIADKIGHIEQALLGYPDYLQLSQVQDPQILIPNAWPNGYYALQKSHAGCPSGWSEGWRYHDTEDDNGNNYWSSLLPSLIPGYFNNNNLRLHYCVKGSSATDYGLEWPKGTYCIARSGGSCPSSSFRTGYIKWDDEDDNNRNSRFGVLPDGSYGGNTEIQYCCRNDERPNVPMTLPTDQNFVLYRYGGTCQTVSGMTVNDLYLRFDNEDDSNADDCSGDTPDECKSSNHVLRFCIYSPETD